MPSLSWKSLIILVLLLAMAVSVYLPGLNGPFLFDDYPNLIENKYLFTGSFDLESLRLVAFSQTSGPLYRPVAMASFAINAHLAGGFVSPVSYRVVNILIHLVNGVLVYLLLRLILQRSQIKSAGKSAKMAHAVQPDHWLVASLAFLWLALPIQLTSILYIVQRMTLLATFFTLLALISYLIGRMRLIRGDSGGYKLMIGGPLLFGSLGVLSKETALLLPIFILLMEIMLFRMERPWKQWPRLSPGMRGLIGGGILIAIAALVAAFDYALDGYSNRPFSMSQRVLTEARVLIFYLSLIVFPRLNDLGLFHDDIALSVSLLDPPTTALAIFSIFGLIWLAVALYRRSPLVALGIAWFFAGHLLESTIFPLEIAHEHRNYLPSFGLPLVLAGIARSTVFSGNRRLRWPMLIFAVGVIFAGVTYLRASQWSSEENLFLSEVRHHPTSHRANVGLGTVLINQGKTAEGMAILRKAADLAVHDAGTPISMVAFSASLGIPVNMMDIEVIRARLDAYPASATTMRALKSASDCVLRACSAIAPHLENWLQILLNKPSRVTDDDPYYSYFLGRALVAQGKLNEAIEAYRYSYEHDPEYLVPLLDIAQIYLVTGRLEYAKIIAAEIKRANRRVRLPRHDELRDLEQLIQDADRGKP